MKRVVVVGVVLVGLLMASSVAMAASKIAYHRHLDPADPTNTGNNEEIFVINPDGTGDTRLTFDQVGSTHPSWSPDGSKIAFRRRVLPSMGVYDLWVMDADGSNPTKIGFFPSDSVSNPSWSPELPPSVTSLTPTNQTIAVFLLGMIASALIMRRRSNQVA